MQPPVIRLLPHLHPIICFTSQSSVNLHHKALCNCWQLPVLNMHKGLFVCWSFTCWQFQDGYWLVTVLTHGDFRVLPHSETRPLASSPDIPLSYIILTLRKLTLPYPNNAERQASINYISHCFGSTGNRTPDLPHGKPMLYQFGQRVRL